MTIKTKFNTGDTFFGAKAEDSSIYKITGPHKITKITIEVIDGHVITKCWLSTGWSEDESKLFATFEEAHVKILEWYEIKAKKDAAIAAAEGGK